MLILDKQLDNNEIIVTVTESVTAANPSFTMQLYSSFSKKECRIELGLNTSQYPERYDLFPINKSAFGQLETGFYAYKIFEVNDLQKVLEQGYLKIKDVSVNPTIKPVENINDTGFIVYQENKFL